MKEYVVGRVEDIPKNGRVAVQAGRQTIAVFRVDDEFYAVHNTCPHKGGQLCMGELVPEKRVVRCPWHLWNWSLETGELDTDPRERIRRYDVDVVDGEVILKV